jgi:hypothetical protein
MPIANWLTSCCSGYLDLQLAEYSTIAGWEAVAAQPSVAKPTSLCRHMAPDLRVQGGFASFTLVSLGSFAGRIGCRFSRQAAAPAGPASQDRDLIFLVVK